MRPVAFHQLSLGQRFYASRADSLYVKIDVGVAQGFPGGGDDGATIHGWGPTDKVWVRK